MIRGAVTVALAIAAWPHLSHRLADASETAVGRVFVDSNGNRQLDKGERLLPGVRVSNGREIVLTDGDGQYQLGVDDDAILFVIKPRGYRSPLDENGLPRFYYIHKPAGSPPSKYPGVAPTGPLPERIDFPLYPQQEPHQFRAILFGDPQPRNQREVDYIAHDVVEDLIGVEASFGVTLGDIAFDNLDTLEPLSRTIGLIGIPWYNVIGNHDLNFEATSDDMSDETFERVYGPSYYAFDHGPVHFIVLDDVEWAVPNEQGELTYRGGLGEEQLAFVKHDLALIPDDQLVVLFMHIPLHDIHNREDLYRLIEQRPFCMSVSAHRHFHQHLFLDQEDGWHGPQPHHHVINVTVSGSWWRGAPDERGIPHTLMADGAPNGYSILSFDGNAYQLDFRAASAPSSHQLRVHVPEEVAAAELGDTPLYVNVFNGSEKTRVEFRIGEGQSWQPLQRVEEFDPTYLAAMKAEEAAAPLTWQALPAVTISSHLWKGQLPANVPPGTHAIEVRSTDMYGRTLTGQRVIRVSGPATH